MKQNLLALDARSVVVCHYTRNALASKVGGPWSLNDVADHNQEKDAWIIVKDRADGVSKVGPLPLQIARMGGRQGLTT